jgi:hypothetical protein
MPGKTRVDPEKRSTFQRYKYRMGAHPFALSKAVAERKWGPEVNERLKAYVSTEKRYTLTIKEENKD